jgi:hypothetical protein
MLARLTLCAVAVSGLLAGLASLAPHVAALIGMDVWALPRLHEEVRLGEQRQAALDEHDRGVRERLALRQRLIGDLLEGRATLSQTADRFRALNAEEPGLPAHVRDAFPGRTDEESICQQVLAFAQASVASDRPEAEPALSHLRAELQQLREGHADD